MVVVAVAVICKSHALPDQANMSAPKQIISKPQSILILTRRAYNPERKYTKSKRNVDPQPEAPSTIIFFFT
jgi:hypothetical protein